MNGYEKRTETKKNAIVNAARDLFSSRGMQDVSISEIAKVAGVSQVSIYNYFGDKNALAKEAFVSYIDTYIARFGEILDRDAPFAEKLELILLDKDAMIAKVSESFFAVQALDDKVLQKVFGEAVKEKAVAFYHAFIEQGKREGEIDSDIPTTAIMDFFMLTMSMLQRPEFIAAPVDYKKGILKLFLHGLIC